MYVITFIAGIVGNAIVCIVIVRHTTMHTATNYYLFSLAVSDLIYLLFGELFKQTVYSQCNNPITTYTLPRDIVITKSRTLNI